MNKQRLDLLLVERGLVENRSLAQRLVMAGQVRVNDQVMLKPAVQVAPEAIVTVDHGPPFVSRGGEKLVAALESFPVKVKGLICADIGASTGGFTDCLLQHGAQTVYSIDVGEGILHWKIRQDPRVVVLEGVNARFILSLPQPVQLVTVDASFISVKILIPVIRGWFGQNNPETTADVIVLIKPQFEAGRSETTRGDGVIRNPEVHRRVLQEVLTCAKSENYAVKGLIRSPLIGPKGNVEFLAWFSYPVDEQINFLPWIDQLIGNMQEP